MGKRTKLILGIVLGAIILFSGALFGLAKYGVINLRMLADTIGVKSTSTPLTVNVSYGASAQGNQTIKLYRKTADSNTLGTTEVDSRTVAAPGTVNFTLASGYVYDVACVNNAVPNLNIHPDSLPTSASVTCGPGGGGGGGSCSAENPCTGGGQWCNINHQCTSSCAGTGQSTCPGGYNCTSGTCTAVDPNACNINDDCYGGKTCQNHLCSGFCSETIPCPDDYLCSNQACVRNPVFSFHGKVVKQSDGSPMADVDVQVRHSDVGYSKTVKTNAAGEYAFTDYPINYNAFHQSNGDYYFARFSFAGYNQADKTLSQLAMWPVVGASGIQPGSNYNLVNNIYMTVNTTTGIMYGSVKNVAGENIEGVTVKIREYQNINPPGSFSKTTVSAKDNFKPAGITSDINYLISDIPGISGGKTYYVELINKPTGYIWDTNNDNADDGISAVFIGAPSFIYGSQLKKDFILKNQSDYRAFVGNVSLRAMSTYHPQISVTITGQNLINGEYADADGSTVFATSVTSPVNDTDTGETQITYSKKQFPHFARYKLSFSANPSLSIPDDYAYFEDKDKRTANGISYFRKDVIVNTNYSSMVVTVKNKVSNQAISGATISVLDPVCGPIITSVSDTDGNAFFAGAFTSYMNHEGRFANCSKPELVTEKSGFVKNLLYFNYGADQTVLLIPDPNDNKTHLYGTVFADYISLYKKIPKAKIKLWPGTNPSGNPTKTMETNNNGEFEFIDLQPGRYVIVAYKDGYLSTDSSTSYINIGVKGKVEISLVLGSPKIEGTEFNLYVLDYLTLEGIKDAEVVIAPNGVGGYTVRTGSSGAAETYGIELGKSYTLTAKKDGITGTSTVAIPTNYSLLSSAEKAAIQAKMVIYLNMGNVVDSYTDVTLKFIDTDSKLPIANLPVKYFINSLHSSKIYQDTPADATATTKADGTAKLKSDFTPSEDSLTQKFFADKTKFSEDEVIKIATDNFGGYQAIYKPIVISSVNSASKNCSVFNKFCEITIELKNNPITTGVIEADIYEGFTTSRNPPNDNASENVALERYSQNGWADYPAQTANISRSIGTVTFSALPPGRYRAKITAPLIYGTEAIVTAAASFKSNIFLCSNSLSLKTVEFPNSIKLVFTDQRQLDRYNSHPEYYTPIAAIIARLKNTSKDPGPVVVVLSDDDEVNAFASEDSFNYCAGFEQTKLMTINEGIMNFYLQTGTIWELPGTVSHEYAHLIFPMLRNLKPDFYRQFESIFRNLKKPENSALADCVFDRISDGNVTQVVRNFGGHPADEPTEMFASFYDGYFFSHERLYGIIKYQSKEKSACQNINAYIWELFTEQIGIVYGNDHGLFLPVNNAISNTGYTFNDIKSGNWRQTIYNTLLYTDKARLQYNRIIAPVIKSTYNAVSRAVISFNNIINSVLTNSGLLANAGTANITIRDKNNNPVPNLVVRVGPKIGITNSFGVVSVAGVPAGAQNIEKIQVIGTGIAYAITTPDGGKITIPIKGTASKTIKINK